MPITDPSQDRYCELYRFAYGETPTVFSYIVSCEGSDLLKFGKSKTPDWRLVVMQVGCPSKLKIEWCWPDDIESEMHEHFQNRRVSGEWFRVGLIEAIAAAAYYSKRKLKEHPE